MPTNMPATELPDLREYLFVDAPRVRMLVSQIRGGAPETTTLATSRSRRLRISVKFLEGERASQRSGEDTIALGDLYVSMLEEDAEALGILRDVSDSASRPKFWKRGGLRRSIEPGMLLRISAPTRLVDAAALVRSWRSFENAFGSGNDDSGQMIAAIEALYGDNLAVTIMPCGANEPGCAFLGVIPPGTNYVALDRAGLFSRIGPDTPELTSIMQIARVPTERESASPHVTMDSIRRRLTEGGESIDRSAIDDLLVEMMRKIEDVGFQSAPKWPAVAMTPLAVYRQVPRAPQAPS